MKNHNKNNKKRTKSKLYDIISTASSLTIKSISFSKPNKMAFYK